MKSLFPPSKQFSFYCRIFFLFLIFFTGFQCLNHWDLVALGNQAPFPPVPAFLLLAAAAFLFDWLLALLLGAGGQSSIGVSGLSFILLPLQGVVLFALSAYLALPFVPVLLCICMLAMAKVILLLRYGLVATPHQASRRDQWAKSGLFMCGMVVYGIAVGEIWGELRGYYHFSQALSALFVFTPLLIIAGGLLSTRAFPGSLWLASVAQFFSHYLLRNFYAFEEKTPFLVIVLIPWVVGACVHGIKLPRRKAILSQAYVMIVLMMLPGYAEVLIRGIPQLNRQFYWKYSLQGMWKNPEDIPALFKNRERPNELEMAGRRHTMKKPSDVFRIVCLGSSSTEGEGDRSEYGYPAQLERILDESTHQEVEVINGGISGAPFFMLETHLKEVYLPMDPDLVIVYFGFNDDNLESRLMYDRMKGEIAEAPFIQSGEELWAATHLKWNPPWMVRGFLALAKSRTFMALVLAVDQLRDVRSGFSTIDEEVHSDKSYRVASVERCVRACLEQGRDLVLIPEVLLVDAHRGDGVVSHPYGTIFKSIAEKYSEQNVYYENVLERFTAELAGSYLVDHLHMNDAGYHFLGERIAEFLFEEEIIIRK